MKNAFKFVSILPFLKKNVQRLSGAEISHILLTEPKESSEIKTFEVDLNLDSDHSRSRRFI